MSPYLLDCKQYMRNVKMVNWRNNKLLFIFLCCTVWLTILFLFTGVHHVFNTILMQGEPTTCPGVLRYMTSGTWKPRDMTSHERKEINNFLKAGRHHLRNASNFERPDRKCGNLSYVKNEHSKWFRVLCNPDGPTPCCFNSLCVNKTVDECRGPFSYDLRSRLHAEYATWQPQDKRCSVKLFNSESACRLLNNSTIFLAGGSLMRGIFIALIQILSGDLKTGGLKKNTPEETKKECAGMYSFHHRQCSRHLDFQPTLCNGSLKLNFKYYRSVANSKLFKHDALQLKGKQNSMIFVGVGLGDDYNYDSITNVYLSPTLRDLRNYSNSSDWPKILWASTHQFGIQRYPFRKTVDNLQTRQFNEKMATYLSSLNIPVFDTFNLTEGLMSIDGTHYGAGVNMLKAQLYFNYMQELKDHQLW